MKNYGRYIYAILAVPAAVLLRYAIIPWAGPGTPFITLFPATVLVALLGGMGPAVLTGLLGVLAMDFFFIPPLHSIDITMEFWARSAVVVLTSTYVGYVGKVLREARTRAEKQADELKNNQADLNRAQTVANTGSWRLDTRQNILTWSDEAYHIFGVPEGTALTYESFLSFIHPDDRQMVDAKWKAAIAGEKYDIEHRIVVNDQIKWVRERADLEFDSSSKLLGGFGTVSDITQRKQAEEELMRSESRYRSIISTALDAFWQTDLQGNIVDANPAACQMLGYTRDELLKLRVSDVEIIEKQEDVIRHIQKMIQNSRDRFESKHRRKDGVVLNVEVNTSFIEDKQCIFAFIRDITERKRAEEALKTAHNRLVLAQQSAGAGMWDWDLTTDKLEWSPELFRLFGLDAAKNEASFDLWRNTMHPEDAQLAENQVKQAIKNRMPLANEYRVVLPDGQIRWINALGNTIYDESGNPRSMSGICLDITERKKTEEFLRTSEEQYRRAIEEAPIPIIMHAEDGEVLQLSRSWTELTGYKKEEIRTFDEWAKRAVYGVGADDVRDYMKKLFSSNSSNSSSSSEFVILTKTSQKRCWVFNASTVGTLIDGRRFVVGMAMDVTERKKVEEELRKSRDELEIRVKERTAELDEAVVDLQKQVESRIKAEETTRSERKRFYDVLETLPAYVCLLTPDYKMPFANKVFREWFGYYPEKKCYEFLFNRTEPCENCETYNVLKTGKSQRWEWTGPNGRIYDIYDFPFKDTDGSQLILEMGIEITERKKAQEALRQTSLYARGLLEASLDPLVTISAEGKITDVNEATIQITGVSRRQLIGTDFSDYFTEPQKARESYKKVFDVGFVTDYPLTVRHKNGRLTDVVYNAVVYKNEAGQIQGVFAAARDITERKISEEQRKVTNSLLELYVKKTSRKDYLDAAVEVIGNWSGCSRVGVRVKDQKGNIPYESCIGFEKDFLAVENHLNIDSDNCLCIRAVTQKFDPSDKSLRTSAGSFYSNDSLAFIKQLTPQQAKDYRGNCMRQGYQSIAVVPIRYRDDIVGAIHLADSEKNKVGLSKVQFVEATISPLIGEAIHRFNAESELEKYRLHLEDLVKQRTEALARSNRDLEQFAYVASHDLQEPLRAVSGFIDLLKMRLEKSLDEKSAEYMNFSVDGVARMQALINGLLEYSRIDSRAKPPEPTDSKAALDSALLHLRVSIEESGAKITAENLPVIQIDPVQLAQLFQNLIGNAIKFRSKSTPRIHVSAIQQDGVWQFAVRDNGIGIDPQYAHKIFLIFQRLHSRKKYPGMGIGLSICKKIVERHGGKIWMESQPGRGSTFYFTLP
jgi:PAS domain S-box-containing protein